LHRLNRQHAFYKSIFNYPQLVPPGVNITHVSRVIDVGAGTGAWALDFVSLPYVRNRDLQVFACDISTEKFPRNDDPKVRKITWFQQDVTKPFEDALLGTFDLINLSFMSFALTARGWQVALRNLYSLLSKRYFTSMGPCYPDTNAQNPVDVFSYGMAILSHTIARILRRLMVSRPTLLHPYKAHRT
jgi:SAM-dependent methyltransferase